MEIHGYAPLFFVGLGAYVLFDRLVGAALMAAAVLLGLGVVAF